MKWPWQKQCEHHLCECGGIKTRQTTLLEFFPDLLHHRGQRLLKVTPPKPVRSTTGLQNWRYDE